MPFIRIYGIPPLENQQGELEKLATKIRTRLEFSKEEFKISKGATTIFFPPDLLFTGLGEEIIVDLGLRAKEGRTDAVIAATAHAIVEIIRRSFPDIPLIECFPNIVPREHFAQSKL